MNKWIVKIPKRTSSLPPEEFINEMGRSKNQEDSAALCTLRKNSELSYPEIKGILEKSDPEPNLMIRDWDDNLNVKKN